MVPALLLRVPVLFAKSTDPSTDAEKPVPDKLILPRPSAKSVTDNVKDPAPAQKSLVKLQSAENDTEVSAGYKSSQITSGKDLEIKLLEFRKSQTSAVLEKKLK